ncbi:hypothetical protein BDZ90DRAFT_230243 [Jaminaea rosea]|uniref:Uncharacterized protein n=1 Tax=Jaminaea rosea TaxID=1569628 RepID=A0A316UVV0_9BASI|nr:hypothetical protein BDZ90DRAFT_230243 [Jaminaea rosea]PWN29362.1 hypothetical protein BDZ90DRAFT_230243 [Jaminaea rosea]
MAMLECIFCRLFASYTRKEKWLAFERKYSLGWLRDEVIGCNSELQTAEHCSLARVHLDEGQSIDDSDEGRGLATSSFCPSAPTTTTCHPLSLRQTPTSIQHSALLGPRQLRPLQVLLALEAKSGSRDGRGRGGGQVDGHVRGSLLQRDGQLHQKGAMAAEHLRMRSGRARRWRERVQW